MCKKYEFEKRMQLIQYKISYYTYMEYITICPCLKKYFIHLIELEIEKLENLFKNNTSNFNLKRIKEFTLEELAQYNGEGRKASYVSVNGIVYDVSMNTTWGGGTHFGLYAGKDLTGEFLGCHKGSDEILSSLPQVGTIKNNRRIKNA